MRVPKLKGTCLALGMLLVVGACSADSTSETDTSADETTTTGVTSAVSGESTTSTTAATDSGIDEGSTFEMIDGVLQPLANGFPDSAITIWNPFSAGSHNDVFNQFLAEVGQKYSPVPLTTATQEAGAALHYGLIDFLQDQPLADDGHHIFGVAWSGMALKRLTLESLDGVGYEVLKPIANMMSSPFVIATRLDSEYESIEDLVAATEATPGELTLGVESAGGNTHIAGLIFTQQAGADMVVLPTGGSAENLALLEGGGAHAASMGFQLGMADRFRVLMVTGSERVDTLPDVPAASEFGWDIPVFSNFGVGTLEMVPDEHVAWMTELFRLVYEDEEFWTHYEAWDKAWMGPTEVSQMMADLTESLAVALSEADLLVANG